MLLQLTIYSEITFLKSFGTTIIHSQKYSKRDGGPTLGEFRCFHSHNLTDSFRKFGHRYFIYMESVMALACRMFQGIKYSLTDHTFKLKYSI